jgi:hypothetical protein
MMYGPGFVAGVLAGFEGALEALIDWVEEETRSDLEGLADRIVTARLRLDPEGAIENGCTATADVVTE